MLKTDATYEYYHNCYCMGNPPVLDAANFELYIKRAKAFLEGVISQEEQEGFEDEIRNALCSVAEKLYEEKEKGSVKSESIDGYSVTFKDSDNLRKRLLSAALFYLSKSDMLYSGVE